MKLQDRNHLAKQSTFGPQASQISDKMGLPRAPQGAPADILHPLRQRRYSAPEALSPTESGMTLRTQALWDPAKRQWQIQQVRRGLTPGCTTADTRSILEYPPSATMALLHYGPTSFPQRLRVMWQVFTGNRDYAVSVASLWLHQLGNGIITGCLMLLMHQTHSAAFVGSGIALTLIEQSSRWLQPLASLHGAHIRDNADSLSRAQMESGTHRYAQGLLRLGAVDFLLSSALLGISIAATYGGVHGLALLAPLAAVRVAQTVKNLYEFNYFNAFKARLPAYTLETEAGRLPIKLNGAGLRFVLLSLEANGGSLMFTFGSSLVALLAGTSLPTTARAPFLLSAIVAGTLIGTVPKLQFLRFL